MIESLEEIALFPEEHGQAFAAVQELFPVGVGILIQGVVVGFFLEELAIHHLEVVLAVVFFDDLAPVGHGSHDHPGEEYSENR